MNEICEKNREDSEKSLDKDKRYAQILGIMKSTSSPLTAREIENEMVDRGYVTEFNLNDVRPRLTELSQLHKIKVFGRQIDTVSGKSNSTYVIETETWKYNETGEQVRMELFKNYGE